MPALKGDHATVDCVRSRSYAEAAVGGGWKARLESSSKPAGQPVPLVGDEGTFPKLVPIARPVAALDSNNEEAHGNCSPSQDVGQAVDARGANADADAPVPAPSPAVPTEGNQMATVTAAEPVLPLGIPAEVEQAASGNGCVGALGDSNRATLTIKDPAYKSDMLDSSSTESCSEGDEMLCSDLEGKAVKRDLCLTSRSSGSGSKAAKKKKRKRQRVPSPPLVRQLALSGSDSCSDALRF